jgi:hypothetical protein
MSDLPNHLFSDTYPEARRRFIGTVALTGGKHRAYPHPLPGPDGGEHATDCAWFGPEDADKVLVLMSGTHGVEGFAGAGPQLDWMLNAGAGSLPEGTATLLIHGIGSWGYAWLRRCTEEGVDLNRNFILFDGALPENPGYDELAHLFVPAKIGDEALADAQAQLDAWRDLHGNAAYLTARGAGQYKHPGGLFYGGTGPTYARRLAERIIADYRLASRRAVGVIDYHTGLGPYGHGELISGHDPDTAGVERNMRWYGPIVAEPKRGTSITVPLKGMSQEGWEREIGDALTFVSIEFGTLPPTGMQRALAQDHWLHNRGAFDWNDAEARRIKQEMYDAYCPPKSDWREMVLLRCRQLARQALEGMQKDTA